MLNIFTNTTKISIRVIFLILGHISQYYPKVTQVLVLNGWYGSKFEVQVAGKILKNV